MAIDDRHEIDLHTGFAVDKETGVPLGLVGAPHLPVSREIEYPKWVTPHESHVVMQGLNKLTPNFPDFHVSRLDESIKVLVKDAEEEARALAAKVESEPEPAPMAPEAAPEAKADTAPEADAAPAIEDAHGDAADISDPT